MKTECAGMSVARSDDLTVITASADVTQQEFRAVLEELGLTGTTDYQVLYDHETGDETWLIPTV